MTQVCLLISTIHKKIKNIFWQISCRSDANALQTRSDFHSACKKISSKGLRSLKYFACVVAKCTGQKIYSGKENLFESKRSLSGVEVAFRLRSTTLRHLENQNSFGCTFWSFKRYKYKICSHK